MAARPWLALLPEPGWRFPVSLRAATALLFLAAIFGLATACSLPRVPAPEKSTPPPVASPTKTAPSPTAVPTVVERKNPPLPASRPVDPAIAARVEPIFAKTAAIRSLPVKSKVPLGILDRSQLRSYLLAALDQEQAKQGLAKSKSILVLLDLLKDKDNLSELQLGLLSEQVIGLYDFDAKEMRLVGVRGQLTPMDEVTLSHEYVHALQDQSFDVGSQMRKVEGNSERTLALQSLVEGDATLASAMYAQTNVSAQQLATIGQQSAGTSQDKLRSAPPILQLGLMFPYLQGAAFVAALNRAGGWPAVDEAFANPPTTSSQIMHPENYMSGKGGAQALEMPRVAEALGSQWVLSKEDVLGEAGVLAYLANGIPAEKAAKAAEGWAGDRMVLFRSSSGYDYALVAVFTWDTPRDATEFFTAVRDLRQPKGGLTTPDAGHLSWSVPDRRGYAAVKDNKTALAITTSDTTIKKIVSALGDY